MPEGLVSIILNQSALNHYQVLNIATVKTFLSVQCFSYNTNKVKTKHPGVQLAALNNKDPHHSSAAQE